MKTERLIVEEVGRIAKPLEEGVLYVSRRFQLMIHLCACGCKGETVTPIDLEDGWVLTLDSEGPTLTPSIGNQNWPCGSHYWVTNGQIVWC